MSIQKYKSIFLTMQSFFMCVFALLCFISTYISVIHYLYEIQYIPVWAVNTVFLLYWNIKQCVFMHALAITTDHHITKRRRKDAFPNLAGNVCLDFSAETTISHTRRLGSHWVPRLSIGIFHIFFLEKKDKKHVEMRNVLHSIWLLYMFLLAGLGSSALDLKT